MKLSKLYSNLPNLFAPIDFQDGLNVVLAEIRLPENKTKDTHNLGKSILGKILNFMLLKGVDKKFFLLKHKDLFNDFVFFLEIELTSGSFLTVRRSVASTSKVSFKRHTERHQNYANLHDKGWDHYNLPFNKSIQFLDSSLNLRDFAPSPWWTFRKGIDYFLRSQGDYGHIFQLSKFLGQHSDWKPFISHLLGLDAQNVFDFYDIETNLDKQKQAEIEARVQFGDMFKDSSSIDNLLLIKKDECEKRQRFIDELDFNEADKEQTKLLVEEYDTQIVALNNARYRIKQGIQKITTSLEEDKIHFDISETEKLFGEVGVLFAGQIKKDFEQLISFNTAITNERAEYLKQELVDLDESLKATNAALEELGQKRKSALSFLSSTDVFDKYKNASDELNELKTEIILLERQKEIGEQLKLLRESIQDLSRKKNELQSKIQHDIDTKSSDATSTLSKIRLFFNDIIQSVIQRTVTLDIFINKEGHLEFEAQLRDKNNAPSSAADGTTYKKLMCVAFDMALLKANLGKLYPRFVYHDGIFETLDDRKKIELIKVIREYNALGIQTIITTIDSDLLDKSRYSEQLFSSKEIVLLLHDEGDSGRIFRMPAW